MAIALPWLFCIIGLLMWFVATNPKVQELGRTMCWTGMLAGLLNAGPLVRLIG